MQKQESASTRMKAKGNEVISFWLPRSVWKRAKKAARADRRSLSEFLRHATLMAVSEAESTKVSELACKSSET